MTLNMITSAVATLSDAASLVKQQNSDSPLLFVIPVVQSFMQKHGRITDELRHQVELSCCQYVMNHACRFHGFTFSINSNRLNQIPSSLPIGSPKKCITFWESVRALQYMGHENLRQGDYQNAYDAYEAAGEQYHGTVDTWDEKRC